jgi:hypothetical protein
LRRRGPTELGRMARAAAVFYFVSRWRSRGALREIALRSGASDFNDCHIPVSSPDEFPTLRRPEDGFSGLIFDL